MNEHDATEIAYKNGYAQAVRDILAEIEENADLLYDGYRDIFVITAKDFAELRKKYEVENNV